MIDRQPTRLGSLYRRQIRREGRGTLGTNWSTGRHCRTAVGKISRAGMVPKSWLSEFTLAEGLQDDLVMELRCPVCRQSVDIPLAQFASRDDPPKTIRDIVKHPVWTGEPCCGVSTDRRRPHRSGPASHNFKGKNRGQPKASDRKPTFSGRFHNLCLPPSPPFFLLLRHGGGRPSATR